MKSSRTLSRILSKGLRELRRRLARSDPAYFAERVLSYQVRPFHRAWLELQSSRRRTLLLAPRGHGKSTIATVSYALWMVVRDTNVRVLIVSNTHAQAEAFLRECRGHMEQNPRFRALFGDLRGSKWTDSEIVCERTRILKEATITALGMGGPIVSRHYDIIICDDIVDADSTATQLQRSKQRTWFYQSLMPCLEPGGEIHVVGTRWHPEDLYGELLRRGFAKETET